MEAHPEEGIFSIHSESNGEHTCQSKSCNHMTLAVSVKLCTSSVVVSQMFWQKEMIIWLTVAKLILCQSMYTKLGYRAKPLLEPQLSTESFLGIYKTNLNTAKCNFKIIHSNGLYSSLI